MKTALRVIRTTCMVGIGIFVITIPFRLPPPTEWAGDAALVLTGAIIVFVEARLWWRV